MEKLEQTKEFGNALKKAAKAPIRAVKSLATEPVGTVETIGSDISNWVSDIGRAVVSDDSNLAGQAILKDHFENGVSPLGLMKGALVPTFIMFAMFFVFS